MSLPLSLLLGALASLRFSHLSVLLPALHGSLPSQLYLTLIPLPLFLLASLLPPLSVLPLLPLLPFLSSLALPLPELILLSLLAGAAAASHRLPALLAFLLPLFLPPNPLTPHLPSLLPSLLPALLTLLLVSRSLSLSALRLRLLSPPSRPPRRKSPRKSPSPLRYLLSLPAVPRALLLAALVFLLSHHLLTPLARSLSPRLLPRALPPSYSILAQARGPTGLVSAVQLAGRYRLLTADMSVLGGRHAQEGYAPDSIFAQFHVHEAVRLTRLPGEPADRVGGHNGDALCIGLGIGVVADALHRLGCNVDAVEIDPVVAAFARRYFGMTAPNVALMDATKFLQDASAKGKRYDYVVHDVFTGGAVPADLFAMHTWHAVRGVLKDDGVVAVNFVGALDDPPNTPATAAVALVYDRLAKAFGHVRVFSDGHDSRTHNLVFFASPVEERVTFRPYAEEDLLRSGVRKDALDSFQGMEVLREKLGKGVEDVEGNDWVLHMGQWDTCKSHLALMRKIHPKELWPALFAKEQMG